jgi:hypothetical protein
VALELAKMRDTKTAAGSFLQKVQKQKPKQYQGIYIVDADGKVLSSQANFKNEKTWTQELLEILSAGLKEFGDITPRQVTVTDPMPHRGLGIQTDGSVTLAIYLRTNRDGGKRESMGSLTLDSQSLSAKEWASFMPPKGEKKWNVPEAVARKWNRVLYHGSDHSGLPLPEEVTAVRMTGWVENVKDGITYLIFDGTIEGSHLFKYAPHKGKQTHGKTMFLGMGAYDAKAGQMLSLTFIAGGNFRNVPPYDAPTPFGAVVEWRRDR